MGYASSLYPFYILPMGTLGAIHPGAEPELIIGEVHKGAYMVEHSEYKESQADHEKLVD